jgi:predicted regulator of Ras-like GTPase activity (Roadblock/LC7/MglB family)
MPTIRDLVGTIRQREGVEAAIVLGRDGLLIDGQSSGSMHAEDVAAHIPSIINAADELGAATARGAVMTAVLEYANGVAIISVLSDDAVLLVLLKSGADLGPLLYELRRNRGLLATLV